MAYDPEQPKLRRVAEREIKFGVYELHLSEEEKQQFSADSEGFLTEIITEESAPSPNELIFADPSTDDPVDNLIDEIVSQVESGGHGGGSSPPVAVVYHQESGDHISRYITIIIPPS
jgi:hypothetical protein